MMRNYIDILLILLVLLSAIRGWQRGLLLGLLDVVTWIGSALLALRYYEFVATWLAAHLNLPAIWVRPAAFLLTVAVASVLIGLLGHLLLRRLPWEIHYSPVNRLLGIVPGLANGLISASLGAALLLALPLPSSVSNAVKESPLANRLAAYSDQAETALKPVFGDAVAHTLNTVTVEPESDQGVKLSFTVADAPPAPELEAQMLELVNQERAKVGLAPLVRDPALVEVARQHSADMFARGYFAHETPEGESPFDRFNKAGITYRTAGENLALAPTLSLAHTGLMNSPGHRANILNPEFGRVGIGIIDGGLHGLMVTQDFRD